jgi:hypothetical protein
VGINYEQLCQKMIDLAMKRKGVRVKPDARGHVVQA